MPMNVNPSLLQRLGRLEFLARQAVEGFITGLHKSPFHGFSVEFAEHRLYNLGESTRHIDWKLYGRSDKLFVKRYEEETNLRCQLVLDCSGSMWYPSEVTPEGPELNKLKFAIHSCAALIELFRRQRDAVGLSVFADELQTHIPAKSSGAHMRMIYNKLEDLLDEVGKQRSGTSTVKALHQIAEASPRRSLVVVFSDLLDRGGDIDELMAALQHLRHNKHEVVLFHVLEDDTEMKFNFQDRPTIFEDLETGEEIRLHPAEVREAYQTRMVQLRKDLDVRCAQYRIDWVDVDTAQGVFPVLSAYLVKRAKMRSTRS
ncbi:MAG TPA: DUF58 domain-containing protein [Flavobacteriales bacterium]|nr:DUF58 domain-containing protein [Flavobacteriales bacterium]